jgi:hypothetical protein
MYTWHDGIWPFSHRTPSPLSRWPDLLGGDKRAQARRKKTPWRPCACCPVQRVHVDSLGAVAQHEKRGSRERRERDTERWEKDSHHVRISGYWDGGLSPAAWDTAEGQRRTFSLVGTCFHRAPQPAGLRPASVPPCATICPLMVSTRYPQISLSGHEGRKRWHGRLESLAAA